MGQAPEKKIQFQECKSVDTWYLYSGSETREEGERGETCSPGQREETVDRRKEGKTDSERLAGASEECSESLSPW